MQSYDQPEGLTAPSQGNAQTTADGNLLVGWGSLPYLSEFAPSGALLFNAEYPTGVNSYRAYTFRWPGSGEDGAPTPPGAARLTRDTGPSRRGASGRRRGRLR